MAASSERRIKANLSNASRSTGPRSTSGRERSRRNALRHGLAAEVLLPEEDASAGANTEAEWAADLAPADVAERALVRRAAVADAQLRRCEEADQQGMGPVARDAVGRWEEAKQHAVRKRAQRLKGDPFNTVLDLEATAFGCDWLIRKWVALDRKLAQGIAWGEADRQSAMRLLGFFPVAPGPDGDPEARQLWHLGLAALGLEPEPGDDAPDAPPDPDAARASLRAIVLGQVERLERLREASWDEVEGPERRAVIAASRAGDASTHGQLRKRYERDATTSLMRSINTLARLRSERDRAEDRQRKRNQEQETTLEPVGGGWARTKDADFAPPGFAPIGRPDRSRPAPAPAPAPASVPAPAPAPTSVLAPARAPAPDALPTPERPTSPPPPSTASASPIPPRPAAFPPASPSPGPRLVQRNERS